MATPLLTLQDIVLSFGGDALLEGAELSVSPGERVCLVGRNGSGKSTLLKIAAGLVEADGGTVFLQPGATVRYLPQEPDLDGYDTVLAYAEAGLQPGDDAHRARYLIEHLGLAADQPAENLSGGEARRAALARVLAPQPDILLLDEPTNHLDLPAIEWLEAELQSLRSALVLISHDRRFLETLSQATVWLDRGRTRRLDQGFAAFESWRDEVLEREETERHKLERKIAMEEDWLRYGVTARRKRNQRRLGLLRQMREQHRTARRAEGRVALDARASEASGKLVVEAKDVCKSYDGRQIVAPFSLRIHRGDRIGIVGPNGAGKTTLVNLLTGVLAPDSGSVKIGQSVEMVTLDQRRESLDPNWTLNDALTGGGGDTVLVQGEKRHVIGYMKDFLFKPEQRGTVITRLSGGERGRLMLARALAAPANFLVLDEPTNDLDLETLDLLQEMLADYTGTVLVVSHDRDFLDRVVLSTLASEGDGRWLEYAGGYSDMVAQRDGVVRAERNLGKVVRKPRAQQGEAIGKPLRKRKLSFNEQHALRTLPDRIAGLEERIAGLNAQLADSSFYSRDPDGFARAGSDLQAAQGELQAAEEEWLRLEMLREELENA
jgi:ATP-binding cassette subfamily F protein uup